MWEILFRLHQCKVGVQCNEGVSLLDSWSIEEWGDSYSLTKPSQAEDQFYEVNLCLVHFTSSNCLAQLLISNVF